MSDARPILLIALWCVATATFAAEPQVGETPTRETPVRGPNFIVIFCDDMGYADIGPFGASGYQTPNLDSMAAEGMVFTDFHVARSFCSPSRAALLTGRYPQEVNVPGNFGPASKNGMSLDAVTIADLLKTAGYRTACIGKWHLGHAPEYLPTRRGFDQFFGLPYSNDMWPFHPENGTRYNFPDLPLMEGTKIVKPAITPDDQKQLTTWYTERSVRFIESNKDRPFFLYLPHAMPHVPLYASTKFDGKTTRGLYGDVIEEIDWGVGEILSTLKRLQIDDRTLVVFTSDNGPWLRYGDHAGSAGPLRAGKGSVYEGGYRVPCVMRWTGNIPPGKTCRSFAATIDLFPTFASLAGVEVANSERLDGKDIRDLLRDEPVQSDEPRQFIHFAGSRPVAVRKGKWKLIFPTTYRTPIAGSKGIPGDWQAPVQFPLSLYDLESDVGETTNLADQHPDLVQELQAIANPN